MKRPIIGVCPLFDSEKNSLWMLPGYNDGIENAGGVPLMLPLSRDKKVLAAAFEVCDGLVLTGGQDVDPALYGGRKETSGERGESARATWKKPARKLKFTYQEQKDYDTIEQEMAYLEDLVCRLDEDILKAATDFVRLNELSKQKEEASAKLEEKMERWMYLEEKAARIEAGDLEDDLIYLACCSGLEGEELAETLLKKGADTVVGATDSRSRSRPSFR